MVSVNSMTMPLRVCCMHCMLRICSAVIPALAMNLLQMKQIVDFYFVLH